MSVSAAIQAAIYARLSTYAPLLAVVAGIHDDVPQSAQGESNAPFPFVTLGEDTVEVWDTDTELGAEATITLHIWSRDRGRYQTKSIQGLIYDALHRHELTVQGHHVVACEWEYSDSSLDPDGRTRHGVMRFRITLQKT